MLVPLALYFAVTDTRRRPMWVGLTALLAVAMLFSVSRSALIAALVGYLVLLVCWPRYRLALIAVAVVGVFATHMLMPGLLGTFRATLDTSYVAKQESLTNDDNRASDYPKVAAIVPRQVLLGLGFGEFDPNTYFYLDNQALKLILELGIAGVLVFAAFVFLTMRTLVRGVRAGPPASALLPGALLASVSTFCVASLFFDTFSFVQVTYLFFILSALAMHAASPVAPAEALP